MLLSVGLVLGVFPISFCPTIFCLIAAYGLRLNAPALQLLNQATSPLQWALLVPLARAGAWLRGDSTVNLGAAAMNAVVGWACICLPLGALLYLISLRAARRRRNLWCNSVESPA
jgi:hypothetical protein